MILATESQMIQTKRNQKGKFNNHYNHPHTPEARAAISAKQRQRYDLLRRAVDLATDDNRIRQVVKEEINRYLKENAIPLNNNKPTNNIPLT